MCSKKVFQYLVIGLLFWTTACGGSPEIIPTPMPSPTSTTTPEPTAIPLPTDTPEPEATPSVPTAAPTQSLPSVGQILATNGRFSTFNTAFELANLDEALGDPGPFTLFAPTNEAFAKLPPGLLDTLRADPKGDLSDLVLRHVVNGRLPAATLGTLTAVTSVYGDPIAIQHTDSNQLLLNDAILIVGEEIPAFNGFVYAIDIVLLPDIAELLPLLPQFTQLTEALQGASLMDMLHGVGPFTLFAPTDAAWAVLSAETLASSDGVGQLLQSHLAGQRLLPPALATADLVPTLGGGEIVVTNAGGSLRLNGAAQLTGVMVQASNGVVLGIDALLVSPPALTDS